MGEQFGPLFKVELDDWVTQGRLTGDCHIFQEGWDEWKESPVIYPELAFVKGDDEEFELTLADSDKVERKVSSSEPAWYTVRTGLTLISNSAIVAIVAFVILAVGFFVDRVPLSQVYFDIMHDKKVDAEHGGGVVSMVLVSWGIIGMFMALVGNLAGAIACMTVPRKTNIYPFAVGAVVATALVVFTSALLFTAAFLSIGPIANILKVGSVVHALLSATPWAFFLCAISSLASIVAFACMLASYLDLPKIAQQMRWFGALQGGFLLWVLIDAAIIPDGSDGIFTLALFVFLVAVIASLAWTAYLTRATRDAIRPG
jgi:hypothetical protein